jgi:peptidoglycan/LPS O-acetylase OafA/YrhL
VLQRAQRETSGRKHRVNKNLDFLRALAVLLTVLGHVDAFFGVPAHLWLIDPYCIGRMGVLLFFVHTSLVLMQSLERESNASHFLIRRIFRIYPLAMVAIIAIVAFHIPQARIQPHHFVGWNADAMDVFANMFLVQDFSSRVSILGPTWSLTYEMLMYLLLPFIYVLIRSKNRAIPLYFAGIIASVLIRQSPVVCGYSPLFCFWYFMPCFLPGVVAYQLLKTKQSKLPAYCWPIALITVCLMYTLMRKADYSVYAFCGLIGLLIPRFEQIKSRVLTYASHSIAKYSYGVYLAHFAAIYLAFEVGSRLPIAIQIVAFIGLLVSIPMFLYHVIEAPMISIGKNLVLVEKKGTSAVADGEPSSAPGEYGWSLGGTQ